MGESEKLNLRRGFIVLRRGFNVLRRRFNVPRRRFNFASDLLPCEVGARALLPGIFVRLISRSLARQQLYNVGPSLTDTHLRRDRSKTK